jgi:imidazolonepropionase-like amidohydrolase
MASTDRQVVRPPPRCAAPARVHENRCALVGKRQPIDRALRRTAPCAMRMRQAMLCCALLLAATFHCTGGAAAPSPQRAVIAITDVTLIDVEHDDSIGSRTVLIEGGRISAIVASRDARIPADAQCVDGRGKFLIPGLVDMHVHLFNSYSKRPPNDWTFPLFVASGVTAVREMNAGTNDVATVRQWRTRTEAGELIAPRIVAVGIAANGHTAVEAKTRVDAAADAGADFIKVFSEVPNVEWRAILDEARARSLPVAGHVPAGVTLLAAAQAGQRTDEHLMQAYEACSTKEEKLIAGRAAVEGDALTAMRDAQEPRVLVAFDARTCARVARALRATGQAQVPTLVLTHAESIHAAAVLADDPRWRYLRPDERARWERIAATPANDDGLADRRWRVTREIASIFHHAGVPMLAGTETPMPGLYPGYSLQEEIALLVEVGFTPREALRAATLAPAEFLGIAGDAGSIAQGKRADLVLLDADPVRDIHNLRRIDAVVIDGRLLRRADLDALLADAAKVH